MKKIIVSFLLAFIFFIFYFISSLFNLNQQFELKTFDLRTSFLNKSKSVDKDIVIILVDEASLKSMQHLVGRWPWPRSLWGDLVDFLSSGNAKLILFDLLFTEQQELDDKYFADFCLLNNNVINAFQIVEDTEDEFNKTLLNQKMPDDFLNKFSLTDVLFITKNIFLNYNNFYLPVDDIYKASKNVGVVEFVPDSEYGKFLDATYRRTHLIREYQNKYFSTLSFAAIKDFLNINNVVIYKDKILLDEKIQAPLMNDGTYLINMKNNFKTYSAGGIFASIQKIKKGEVNNLIVVPDEFDDKIVLVGTSAAGIADLKSTSIGENVPGVFLHASIISNFLEQEFIYKANKWLIGILVFLLSWFVAFFILKNTSIILHNIVPVFLIFIYVSTSFFLFYKYTLWVELVNPCLSIILCYIFSYVYLSSTEGKEKRRTRKMLSQYVSPAILTELVRNTDKALKAEVGSKVELTILFSDIRDFTKFSETAAPEQVVEMLNYYLDKMVNIVFKHNGTLDKFIGDAVMAFWGAPLLTNDHAELAILSAMEMRKSLIDINKYFKNKKYPEFNIGVGLHTGEVILGNIGSDKKLDYTVIGDNVNLASRIEGLTKFYGQDILITEKTYEKINKKIPCRIIDIVKVKGKEKTIKIFSPLSLPDAFLIKEQAQKAFDLYFNRKWNLAIDAYLELKKIIGTDDLTSNLFIARCKNYINNEPVNGWDGVHSMELK